MRIAKYIPLAWRMKLLDIMATVPVLRPPVWRILNRVAHRAFIENNPGGHPQGVQEDKVAMLQAIMNTIERGLASGLIGPNVRHKLAEVYLGMIVFKPQNARRLFMENYGMRPPGFITISPTARCNLRCSGCYAGCDEVHRTTLPFPVFDRILREKVELWGSHFTVISGGEPFLYYDGGHGLLDVIERHPDQFFLVYTNGTLISKTVAARLGELGNVTPAISVEGFEQDTDERRGKGVFKRILTAFDNLRAEGVPFGISATVFRHNADYILDGEHIDFFFRRQGATYAWIFQYMPIGRGMTLDRMLTPTQRLNMYSRTWKLIRERKLFIADFWNCGTVSDGCIAAAGGKGGGYFYIDWNGAVAPCVFNPFATHNIKDVYASGGDLNTVVFSQFFKDVRQWQRDYYHNEPLDRKGSLIAPCPFRDHHASMRDIIDRSCARPIDDDGHAVLDDTHYGRQLANYGDRYRSISYPVWEASYLGRPHTDARKPSVPAQPLGSPVHLD
jgi:MoaA/NifB/PqqE/SkfB family radical SAM enzyme